jgi:hypothetical protein
LMGSVDIGLRPDCGLIEEVAASYNNVFTLRGIRPLVPDEKL